jgi:asparagine synthase (glutamine-hydrolysing)
VTVALNGDGGDESFGGYERYLDGHRAPHLDWVPRALQRRAPAAARLVGEGRRHSGIRTKVERLGRVLAMSPAERYATAVSTFDAVRRRRLLTPEFAAHVQEARPEELVTSAWTRSAAADPVDAMSAVDVETYLPDDLLVKMDVATMAYSVEARSPFLDHRLMEFAASIPSEHKLSSGRSKAVLRSALRRVLPEEILERQKMGFAIPLRRWFREELRDLPAEILLDRRSIDRGYFQRGEIESLIREHQEGDADHSLRLWVLLQLETWHREVVEAPQAGVDRAAAASPSSPG